MTKRSLLPLVLVAATLFYYFDNGKRAKQLGTVEFQPSTPTQDTHPIPSQTKANVDATKVGILRNTAAVEDEAAIQAGQRCLDKFIADFRDRQTGEREYFYRQTADVIGRWYFTSSDTKIGEVQDSTTAGKFLLAMGKVGLLEGAQMERDMDGALRLLEEVIEEEPENSAPYAYLAYLYDSIGDQVLPKEYLRRLESTSYFDTYTQTIWRKVWSQVRTAEDYISAIDIVSTAPTVKVMILQRFLTRQKDLIVAGHMVMGKGGASSLPGIDYSLLEYSVGRSILQDQGSGQNWPSPKEIREMELNANVTPSWKAAMVDFGKECDLKYLDRPISEIREHFSKN